MYFKLEIKKDYVNSFLTKFQGAGGYWDQQVIDDAAADALKDAPELFKDYIDTIIEYLDKKSDFKQAIKGLPALLKEFDTEALEEQLTNILFASGLTGSLAVKDELGLDVSSMVIPFYYKGKAKLDLIKELKTCFDKAPEEAVEYLKSKDIVVSKGWQEQADLIRKHSFTVANVGTADMLQLFFDELNSAMDLGTTFQAFRDGVNTMLQQKGYLAKPGESVPRRLDTIYRTNMQASYMAGRWRQMNEVTDDFPYWEFVAVTDVRTTDSCRGLDGVVLPVSASFWKKNFPPRHYNCRSRTRALSDDDIQKRGLKVADPEKYEKTEPSEGFDNSPADEWNPDLGKYAPSIRKELESKLEEAPPVKAPFVPAKNLKQAEKWAKENLDAKIEYNKFVSIENANEVNRVLYEWQDKFKMKLDFYVDFMNLSPLNYAEYDKKQNRLSLRTKNDDIIKRLSNDNEVWKKNNNSDTPWMVSDDLEDIMLHEIGHFLDYKSKWNLANTINKLPSAKIDVISKVSAYGNSDINAPHDNGIYCAETSAEAFVAVMKNKDRIKYVPDEIVKLMKGLLK